MQLERCGCIWVRASSDSNTHIHTHTHTHTHMRNRASTTPVYCLDVYYIAVYSDISLEQTGDALVDHPVSCTSLLTAADMLS